MLNVFALSKSTNRLSIGFNQQSKIINIEFVLSNICNNEVEVSNFFVLNAISLYITVVITEDQLKIFPGIYVT